MPLLSMLETELILQVLLIVCETLLHFGLWIKTDEYIAWVVLPFLTQEHLIRLQATVHTSAEYEILFSSARF